MNTDKLPPTDSIQELAQFWDTHDLTDFTNDLEEVSDAVFDRETTLIIHLSSKDTDVVNEIAKAKGLDEAELIREWVVEKVQNS